MKKQSKKQVSQLQLQQSNMAKQYLQNYVESFLLDCIGKDEKEVLTTYDSYNKMWVAFAKGKNKFSDDHKNKLPVVNTTVFQASCNYGRKHLHFMSQQQGLNQDEFVLLKKEYSRIFRIVENKTLLSKFSYWLGKHFFTQSTKYNLDGTLKTQLRVVE